MKNEIISINRELGGTLVRSGSLDFAESRTKNEKNIYRKIAYFVRAIVIDHPFDDYNKSTATIFALRELDRNELEYSEESVQRAIRKISKNNISSIETIEKMIRRAK